jgi:UDP-glucuronate 4-epimerase
MNMLLNPPKSDENGDCAKVYNIGNNNPEKLMYFIETLEKAIGKVAEKEYLPMQPGDVPTTYADTTALERDLGFKPHTPLRQGLRAFAQWYKEFYG